MQDYFTSRSNLAGVLLLIDASIPPMKKDKEYADWLIQHNVPFTIVFTIDLVFNMFGSLLQRFVWDIWNLYDLVVLPFPERLVSAVSTALACSV